MSSRKLYVILSDEAEDDFESITLYGLLTWGEEQAKRYHAEISDMLDRLATFPSIGRRFEVLAGEVRTASVRHHRIAYRVSADAVLEGVHEAVRLDSLRSIVPPNAAQIIASLVSANAS